MTSTINGATDKLQSEYRLKRRVQFAETDLAGFVHFTRFFRYMEEAEHALWREAGLSIVPPRAEIGFPRLATSFEYFRPLKFEDEFEVCIRIAEITDKTMRYQCVLTKDGEKVAAGSLTMACVRKVADEPIRMISFPPDIRDRFEVANG
jgi:acyl-CoA thioester hydrolase